MRYDKMRTGGGDDLKVALVTGATGFLGRQLSLQLSRDGWKVALVSRDRVKGKALVEEIAAAGGRSVFLQGDLLKGESEAVKVARKACESLGSPHLFIHAAGLPVKTSDWLSVPEDLDGHMALNVKSYLAFAAALLPEMLRAQEGTLVAVLSQAMLPPAIPGWQSYAIAKAALGQAAQELSQAYGAVGIRPICVFLGALRSERQAAGSASEEAAARALQARWPVGLKAEEAADAILNAVKDPALKAGDSLLIDAKNAGQKGVWGVFSSEKTPQMETIAASSPSPESPVSDPQRDRLRALFLDLFGLARPADADSCQLGVTPGWDSLAHIKLVVAVEAAFGVRFTSDEAANLRNFSGLLNALKDGRSSGDASHSHA